MERAPGTERVIVGRIGAPYGVKGWVRITSFTDPAGNILEYRPWSIRRGNVWRELAVDASEARGETLLARFAECRTRDEAAALRGSEIGVPASSLPALDEGEYYWRQLVGLAVESLDGRRLGCVERMMATGANDVLVVRGDQDSVDRRERLIPFLPDQVIRTVDLERGVIQVDWDADF